jgi:hypothetical protein
MIRTKEIIYLGIDDVSNPGQAKAAFEEPSCTQDYVGGEEGTFLGKIKIINLDYQSNLSSRRPWNVSIRNLRPRRSFAFSLFEVVVGSISCLNCLRKARARSENQT